MNRKVDWRVLILSLVIVYLVGFIGSLFTSGNVDDEWYESIKPSITPPNWVFPIVWNILYFLVAVSFYFVLESKSKLKNKAILIFVINFLLNVSWSYFYFSLKNPLLAFFDLILLWISILAMISICWKIDKRSCYLLIPYFLWVSFAGALNFLSIRF